MNAYFFEFAFSGGKELRFLSHLQAAMSSVSDDVSDVSDDFDFVSNENEKMSLRDVYTTLKANNLWYTVVTSKLNDISNAFLEDLRKKLKHEYTTAELMTLLQDMKTIHTIGLEAFAKSYIL